jgi:hypothetical protein
MPHPNGDHEAPKSIAKRIADSIWPSCRDVARLTSEGRDHPLSPGVRIKLVVHRLFCKWCARYARQLKFLHDASQQFPEHADKTDGKQLDSDAKARLKRFVREQLDKSS